MDIFEAIYKNDIVKVKELIDSGIDINTREIKRGLTPLHSACFRYYSKYAKKVSIDMVKLILEHPDTDVTIKDNYGLCCLKSLGYLDFFDLIPYIISHKSFDIKKYFIGKETGFSLFVYRVNQFNNPINEIEESILKKVRTKMEVY